MALRAQRTAVQAQQGLNLQAHCTLALWPCAAALHHGLCWLSGSGSVTARHGPDLCCRRRQLSPSEREAVFLLGEERRLAPGSALIEEGGMGHSFFFIVDGSLHLSK